MTFCYEYHVFLITRPEKASGDPEVYNAAADEMRGVLEVWGIDYQVEEDGGAFCGPKNVIMVVNALGREWQGPTLQLGRHATGRVCGASVDGGEDEGFGMIAGSVGPTRTFRCRRKYLPT